MLASVADGPHAPWWEPADASSLNPTAGIAGLLHKHGVDHPWLEPATAFCWDALEAGAQTLGGDDAISVLEFLEHVPDRVRAEASFEPVGRPYPRRARGSRSRDARLRQGPARVRTAPERLARQLFDDETIEQHLDALAAKQQEDGGWPITWEPPSDAAVGEWRGFVTVMWLDVLASYGRI